MTKVADFELLKLGPRSISLADTFDFRQVQMPGLSLAIDAESRERVAAANSAGKVGVAAKAVIPALVDMLGQDRITAATGDLVERFNAGVATKADGHRAENMARLAEATLHAQSRLCTPSSASGH